MLILTRKVGESIMIGNDVTVTIISTKGQTARLGVSAPEAVPVFREEVYHRLCDDKHPIAEVPA